MDAKSEDRRRSLANYRAGRVRRFNDDLEVLGHAFVKIVDGFCVARTPETLTPEAVDAVLSIAFPPTVMVGLQLEARMLGLPDPSRRIWSSLIEPLATASKRRPDRRALLSMVRRCSDSGARRTAPQHGRSRTPQQSAAAGGLAD